MSTAKSALTIKVQPGTVVRLPGGRTTSVHGGTVSVGEVTAAERAEILALKGVSEVGTGSRKKEE